MKKYTIKSCRCGYQLIDKEENCAIDTFHCGCGFHCLQDVIQHILKQGDIKIEQLDI